MEPLKATTCTICGVFLFNVVLHVCNQDIGKELKIKYVPQFSNVLLSTNTTSATTYLNFPMLTQYSVVDKFVHEIKPPIIPQFIKENALRKGTPEQN